jgi:hypothetical protein
MTQCLTCEKQTDNPKFCSSSCAAKYNNKKHPKRAKEREAKRKECANCSAGILAPQKYCSVKCQKDFQWKERKNLIEAGEYPVNKRYLLEVRGHQCEVCLTTEWQGQPIPIEMDHIDGNADNNRIENVRLICPNCHAQTPTYKARNTGKGRHFRRKRYHNQMSY